MDTKNTPQALEALEVLSEIAWEALYSQERDQIEIYRVERAVEWLGYITTVIRNHEQEEEES